MKVKLRSQITPADIAALADIYRDLQKLMVGPNPSAGCHAPLFAALATVQSCAAEWSGNGQIFREPNSIGPQPT
ncbi:hypothetical protein [Brevundimonas sp.]|uniref:hypothetical protein n=1 Tax=Brevundimonas sp. TaxID=1871086 RepID=UPI0028ACA119|nr:hypothetical protein [Brevundimonas sp.]